MKPDGVWVDGYIDDSIQYTIGYRRVIKYESIRFE